MQKLSEVEDEYFKFRLPKYKEYINKRRCPSSAPMDVEIWNIDNLRNIYIADPIQLGIGLSGFVEI